MESEASIVSRYLKLEEIAKSAGVPLEPISDNNFSVKVNERTHYFYSLDGVSNFIFGIEAGAQLARDM